MSAAADGPPGDPGRRRRGSLVLWLRCSVAGCVLLLCAAGVLMYLGVAGQAQVTHGPLQRLQTANARLRAEFAGSQAALYGYLGTGEPGFLGRYADARAAASVTSAGALRLAGGGAVGSDLRVQRRAARSWFGYADRMQAAAAGSATLRRLTGAAEVFARSFYTANNRVAARLRGQAEAATSRGRSVLERWLVAGGSVAALAVLLGCGAAVAALRKVALPLQDLAAALRRLSSGDHAARAAVAGTAETRQAAASLNAFAGEADLLRVQEAERSRLLTVAREAGLRIRENLRAVDVLREARLVIERELAADIAYLHLVEDGRVGLPLGHEDDWALPRSFLDLLDADFVEIMRGLFPRHGALVVQDFRGPDGTLVPPEIRQPLIDAGLTSQVLAPFGVGEEMLGFIVLSRRGYGRPWTQAEVSAVESIATDLGVGLQHARMYEAENTLVLELREIDRMKSDFLATVSHELRTPLTSIAGYVEMLQDGDAGPVSPEQAEMLDTVQRNTGRLRHLIEDVLTLSRIESRAFRTAAQPADVAEIAAAAVTALRPQADAQGLTLALAIPAGGLIVSGDPGQLDRLLMNLLSNAVKFTPPGGKVEVSVTRDGEMAVIAVSDSGIGIPEREQKEIFTRFFRASNATERSIPGTGLGLAIVHAIVANHGGELELHSREGQGTTVSARIPLLTARAVTVPPAEPPG